MTLEGANILNENNDNTIYTMNSAQTGQYCVVIPKNTDNINMLVDLNMKNSFDSLANNTIDKDTLIKEITEEYTNIMAKYPSGVLVLPMIDTNELSTLVNSEDKQKMFDETKKIGNITSEIYKKLSNAGIDKSKINQKIIIVEKTEIDNKFVTWLEGQMSDFVEGISYDEFKGSEKTDNINPFTGEESTPTPVDDIFGTPESTAETTPTEEPTTEEPVVEETTDTVPEEQPNDIFGTPEPTTETTPTEEPTTEKPVVEETTDTVPEEQPNDIFGTPEPTAETTPTEDTQAIPVPQPIENTKLETTQVIPTTETENVQTTTKEETSETSAPEKTNEVEELNELDKKSGGFANLIILAVILIVVTVASIELGKFLYNTFGA